MPLTAAPAPAVVEETIAERSIAGANAMKTRIQKHGDDLFLLIPADIAAQLGFTDGSEVEVALQWGRLVVYPPGQRPYTLEEALEGMTDDQLHGEIDFGPPVGRELI